MEKDRKQRYQNAADMRADLELLRKETESGLVKSPIGKTAKLRVASKSFAGSSSKVQTYLLISMAALLVMIVAARGGWWLQDRAVGNCAEEKPDAGLLS